MNKKKTNVLFILSDDQGAWAMGCAGNPEIRTPQLDALAQHGMRFENFFCVSPVCSPARASLLTGRIPSQHGIHDYLRDGNGGCGQKAIPYLEKEVCYTDILADHGYQCALSGKWHLGDGARPQHGFEFWFSHQKGGGPYYNAPMFRNGEPILVDGYITDVITDEAISFLRSRDKDRPFYLSVHYTAPHSPWVGCHPEAYTRLYEDCAFENCPQAEPHPWAVTGVMPAYHDPRPHLIGYYAAITAMDANVGRLLACLEDLGVTEDTLVIFTSDNGFNCGHHGIWGKGNGTFPLKLYDTSIKVPFIVSHPGRIPAGITNTCLVSAYDFFPTLLDYLDIPCLQGGNLPGTSFLPLLKGGRKSCDRPVVVFDEYGAARMIRTENYKYIHRYPYGPNEFYDLRHDPQERSNQMDRPEFEPIIQQLRHQMEVWFCQYAMPQVDGTREAVKGGGQMDLAGIYSNGKDIYPVNR